jgi:hypothetical protein
MKARSVFILQQRPWSLEAVSLGRFVQSTTDPHRDFHDAAEDDPVKPLVTKLANLSSVGKSASGRSFGSNLCDLLTSDSSGQRESKVNIDSADARTYQLQNQSAWFKSVVEKDSTQKWLEGTFKSGEKAFLVVGFLTLADARTSQQTSSDASTRGSAKAPLSAALAAGGIVLPIDIGSPQIGFSSNRRQMAKDEFNAPGELVYAVEYRRVAVSGFLRKRVEQASLKSNQWVGVWGQTRSDQQDRDRVLEAELDENEIEDEIETEELDYVFIEAEDQ